MNTEEKRPQIQREIEDLNSQVTDMTTIVEDLQDKLSPVMVVYKNEEVEEKESFNTASDVHAHMAPVAGAIQRCRYDLQGITKILNNIKDRLEV